MVARTPMKIDSDHISKQEFLIEFFGPFGRDFGDPKQWFTDNPMDIFSHIEKCKQEKKPAFISVQPRTEHHTSDGVFGVYGIEKIFYDFDYGRKSDNLSERQVKIHRLKMKKEIKIFINQLRKRGIIPLIIKTRKGYHFHVYFDSIYQIDNDEDFWRKTYEAFYNGLLKGNSHKYKYADTTSSDDIFRLCRIPTSIHQKSGEECIILDMNLKPTKIRSLEYFKVNGLRREDFIRAVKRVFAQERKRKEAVAEVREKHKENHQVSHGFTGQIRPCFKKFMKAGEAQHQVRLAMVIEAFYAGHKSIQELIDWFRWARDWDGDKSKSDCRTQIEWFWKRNVTKTRGEPKCKIKPYRCNTIREFGWCLGEECPIYRVQKERGLVGKTKRKKT